MFGLYFRAHIDYLMMAQLLFIFFLLFRQYAIDPPVWVVGCRLLYRCFFNPLAFLVRGLTAKPAVVAMIPVEPYFLFQAGLCFTLTSVGFLTVVALVLGLPGN